MGLDQYAYIASKAGAREEFYEAEYGEDESKKGTVKKPHEICYWRKHPNLQGWMEKLWESRGKPNDVGDDFNGVELELTYDDLMKLEADIKAGEVAKLGTKGFFFGDPSDEYYREHDLEFIAEARSQIFLGFRVFYNSSW